MTRPTAEEEAFARLLEGAGSPRDVEAGRMLRLATALERFRPETAGPSPAFAEVLRARVIAEAERAARIPLSERVLLWARARNEAWRRSLRTVAAVGMAAMLLLGSSAALASARNALPGQWNYKIKRIHEGIRLSVTRAPLDRGLMKLGLAQTRLDEIAGLARAGVRDDALYSTTLADMDGSTLDAVELLVEASRRGAGRRPLDRLAAFATAQRLHLEALVVQIPVGARPAARDSLVVLVRVRDRVQSIIAGCPCPANPLEAASGATGADAGVGCACDDPAGHAAGDNDPDASGSSTNGSGSSNGSGTPGGDGTPGTDLVDGTDADDPANDAVDEVNDILDGLGLPTVPPTPLPAPTATPSVGL